ncbi:DRC7, partial [Symbiodinium microadriaticum]
MHAWVLVRAGMRDVEEHNFLEPSTGRAFPTSNSPYLAIESLWNKSNYWVNVNIDLAPSMLDYALSTPTSGPASWERVFLESSAARSRGTGAGGNAAAKEHNHSHGDIHSSTDDGGVDSAAVQEADVLERKLDPPPPWCSVIAIDRAKFLMRYPPVGRRTVQYHKAKVDYFARNQHPQAMVMRVILYLDTARITVSEIHEWFENRRDKMYKRVRYLLQGRFVEEFFPGSVGEVKRWEEWPGKRRDLDFYVDGRLDRMFRREEEIGERISESFSGRPDFLTYRSILVTLDKDRANAKNSYTLPAAGLAGELYVLRINQSFDRDPSVPSGTDISHRIFHLTEGRVNTQYHFAEGKITQKVKSYSHAKSGGVLAGTGDDMSSEDMEGIQEAALIERECFTAVKTSYVQMVNIVKIRSEFEVDVHNDKIEKTVFENALERAEKGATGAVGVEEDNQSDAKGVDYLTPFLRNIKDLSKITKEEALE